MRNLFIPLLSLFLLFSCDDKNDCRGFKLGQEFEISIEETLQNCLENVSITLLDIQDSRCPDGVQCVWAGMIVIEGEMISNGRTQPFQLSNNQDISGFSDQFSNTEYTVKLIDVVPYPTIDAESKDKRAILTVSTRST